MCKALKIAVGKLRLFFGFCPKCNSDAPELYDCTVCEFFDIPKDDWWERFKIELE